MSGVHSPPVNAAFRFDDNGTMRTVTMRRGVVVGPAVYAAPGISVDESSRFSRIVAVILTRSFVTATGIDQAYPVSVGEGGSDLYASGKFRIRLFNALRTHTHSYDKTDTPTGTGNSGVAGVDPHTHGLTFTSTASSPTGSVGREENAATDYSDTSFEYIVIGVPV